MMTKSNGTEARVQVAIRARPLNQREVKKPLLFSQSFRIKTCAF